MKSILCTLVLCMFMGGGRISVFGKTVRPAAESGCSASPAGSEKISKQRARAYRKKQTVWQKAQAEREAALREARSSGTKPCGNGKWLCARPSLSARRHFVRRESSGTKPCGNGKWLCARPSLSARRHFVRRKSSGTKPCENGKWLCAGPGSSVKRLCAKRVRNAGRTWTLPCESSEKSCKRQLQSRKGRYARPSGPGNGHGGVRKRPIGGGGRFFVGGNSRMASSRTGRGWPTGGPDKAVYFGFRCSAVFSSGFPCAPAFRFTGRKWRGSE